MQGPCSLDDAGLTPLRARRDVRQRDRLSLATTEIGPHLPSAGLSRWHIACVAPPNARNERPNGAAGVNDEDKHCSVLAHGGFGVCHHRTRL
jgi:hypothetical protein